MKPIICRLPLVRWGPATVVAALAVAGCSANLASGPPSDSGPNFTAHRIEESKPSRTALARDPAVEAPAAAATEPAPAAASAPARPSPSVAAAGSGSPVRRTAELAKANAESPGDAVVAMAYVRVLKSGGKRTEALAVLGAAADANPADQALSTEQGLLALELGRADQAQAALSRAAQGPNQDWRLQSGLGVAAASRGDQRQAQQHFAKALELSPGNPVVLNNMAMSLVLDRKVDQAEAMLRRAARGTGAPRQQVMQNLALTKALKAEGLHEEDAQ